MKISAQQYRALAEFRYQLRRFLRFSEEAAWAAGLEPQQHQLLLAVKGHAPAPASIGYLAERLQVRHHSVVGLVDRLEQANLVKRARWAEDRRAAIVRLTPQGRKVLRELSRHHWKELRSSIPDLLSTLTSLWNGAKEC